MQGGKGFDGQVRDTIIELDVTSHDEVALFQFRTWNINKSVPTPSQLVGCQGGQYHSIGRGRRAIPDLPDLFN